MLGEKLVFLKLQQNLSKNTKVFQILIKITIEKIYEFFYRLKKKKTKMKIPREYFSSVI